jgi:hypothetical protein
MLRSRRALLRIFALAMAVAAPLGIVVAAPATIASAAASCVASGPWSGNCEISQGNTSTLTLAIQTDIFFWAGTNVSLPASCSTSQDGVFGPATKTAVECFQSHHGLSADGVVGPNTWAKLQAQLGQKICPGNGWCFFMIGSNPIAPFRQFTSSGVWYVVDTGSYVQMNGNAPPS